MIKSYGQIFYHIFLVIICSFVNIGWIYIIKPHGLLILIVPFLIFIVVGFLNKSLVLSLIYMVAILVISGFGMRLLSNSIWWLILVSPIAIPFGLIGIFAGWMLQGVLRTTDTAKVS